MRQVTQALDEGRRNFTVDSSNGGNVLLAQVISDLVNSSGGTVTVTGRCWSACALMVLGVEQKYATEQADVRIHGATDIARPSDGKPADEVADYMIKSGLPESIARTRGKGANLYKLSPVELAQAGVRSSKPCGDPGNACPSAEGRSQ